MTDLFISYSSHDRPWAEQLFKDFQRRFPTINVFWDRNPASIPPGEPYRQYFERGARDTSHFVVFWSAAAFASPEVNPEIQAFLQNVQTNATTAKKTKRRPFYIQLQHDVAYGPLTTYQGFPDFQKAYEDYAGKNPKAPNDGIAELDAQAGLHWDRMVGMIGNAVLEDQADQPIALALVVMTNDPKRGTVLLDPLADISDSGGPSLNEFLQSVGLSLDDAKRRYGASAFDWRPFGTPKTIIDLMQEVREVAAQNLDADHLFHWRPIDLLAEGMKATEPTFRRLVEDLSKGPSIVVTDPISLFHPIIQKMLTRLGDYAKKPQSMIVSISPNEAAATERLYSSLLNNGRPIFEPHLSPKIPASDPFGICSSNVQHTIQIERLIRSGLGYYYLQKKKNEAKPLVSSGG